MKNEQDIVFGTARLEVRVALKDDADFFARLWNNPKVMKFVGFPKGLRVTPDRIVEQLQNQPDSEFNRLLVVQLKESAEAIGECLMNPPDDEGVSKTDVKLLPEFWGNKFGVEVKWGLVDYLFIHTDCTSIEASPNVENIASIKMQEAVGANRIREAVHEFPEEMQDFTCPVHHYIYRVSRTDWEQRNQLN